MSALRFERVTLDYAGHRALDDVSFAIAPGEIVALIGETGSGKSSAALAAADLLPPSARVTGAIEREARAAMVFQEPLAALNPLLTIGAQVAEGLRLHRRLDRRSALREAGALLAEVGLDTDPANPRAIALGRFPHELSGGQRQRVCIAIALACNPALLIADEPTTALDPESAAQIVTLLARLARSRAMALLIVSHDLDLVKGHADRLILLDRGQIVESGALPGALALPRTARLIGHLHHVPIRTLPLYAPPVLEVRELTHAYGAHRVLDGIDLAITPGEIVGLVGGSGQGKSTLVRMVLGLDHPQSGQVLLDGEDLHRAKGTALRALRRRIQAVFQDPGASLDPRWRVGAIVGEPLGLLPARLSPPETRRRVEAALARVGLPAAAAERAPAQFSGGQRQRIALARALVVEPEVVVLDEATSALDAAVRAEMLDLIASLAAGGTAFLFVSHDLPMITGLADRVFRLHDGRLERETVEAPRPQTTAAP